MGKIHLHSDFVEVTGRFKQLIRDSNRIHKEIEEAVLDMFPEGMLVRHCQGVTPDSVARMSMPNNKVVGHELNGTHSRIKLENIHTGKKYDPTCSVLLKENLR